MSGGNAQPKWISSLHSFQCVYIAIIVHKDFQRACCSPSQAKQPVPCLPRNPPWRPNPEKPSLKNGFCCTLCFDFLWNRDWHLWESKSKKVANGLQNFILLAHEQSQDSCKKVANGLQNFILLAHEQSQDSS